MLLSNEIVCEDGSYSVRRINLVSFLRGVVSIRNRTIENKQDRLPGPMHYWQQIKCIKVADSEWYTGRAFSLELSTQIKFLGAFIWISFFEPGAHNRYIDLENPEIQPWRRFETERPKLIPVIPGAFGLSGA